MPYGNSIVFVWLFQFWPSEPAGTLPSSFRPVVWRLFPLQPGYVMTVCAATFTLNARAIAIDDSDENILSAVVANNVTLLFLPYRLPVSTRSKSRSCPVPEK